MVNLSPIEIGELEKIGIIPESIQERARGKNRIALSANQRHQVTNTYGYNEEVIILVPSTSNNQSTPNARKNAKGDPSLQDFEVRTQVYGKNNAHTLVPDGRRLNVIRRIGVSDLEKHVIKNKPLDDTQFIRFGHNTLRNLFDIMKQGYFHRDIKPDNCVVSYGCGEAEMTDFELAGKISDIQPSPLPTRGTGTYAHPSLLNATFTKQPAKATERTEVYSLGATFYFALTGKLPSPYAIIESEDGTPVEIDEKIFKLQLVENTANGAKKIEKIDEKAHEKRIVNMMQDVPEQWRSLIHGMMSDTTRNRFHTFADAEDEMYRVELGEVDYRERADYRNLGKAAGIVAASILGLSALLHSPANTNQELQSQKYVPTSTLEWKSTPAHATQYVAQNLPQSNR